MDVHRQNTLAGQMGRRGISFSLCVNNDSIKNDKLIEGLKKDFKVHIRTDLELITIKNYDQRTVKEISKNRQIVLEQRTLENYQIVVVGNLEKPVKNTLDIP
jgi:aspartate kinase